MKLGINKRKIENKNRGVQTMEYQRLISYIYSYENGLKKENVGYARIELRNGQGKVTLHIKAPFMNGKNAKICFFHRNGRELEGICIGNLSFQKGNGDGKYYFNTEQIGDSGYAFSQMGGMIICQEEKYYFGTEWDDAPIVVHHFRMYSGENKREDRTLSEKMGQDVLEAASLEEGKVSNKSENVMLESTQKTPKEVKPLEYTKDDMELLPEENTVTEKETAATIAVMKEDANATDKQREFSVQLEESEQDLVVERNIKKAFPIGIQGIIEGLKGWKPQQEAAQENKIKFQEVKMTQPIQHDDLELEETKIAQTVQQSEIESEEVKVEPPTQENELGSEEVKMEPSTQENEPDSEEVKMEPSMQDSELESEEIKMEPSMQENEPRLEEIKMEPLTQENEPELEQIKMEPPTQENEPELEQIKMAPPMQKSEAEFEEIKMAPPIQEGQTKSQQKNRGEKILEKYEKMYPFEDDEIVDCVKVEPQDIGMLPMELWVLANNSFLLHGYYSYRHLIFAKYQEEGATGYILGIPGTYHYREEFMAKMFGFGHFKSVKKSGDKMGSFGYWYQIIHL